MDFKKMLTEQTCACGKTHSCNIKHVLIEPNVLEKYDDLVADYKHILLVADQNTYEVFGKEVEKKAKTTKSKPKVETVATQPVYTEAASVEEMNAYNNAVAEKYRFFSFGDAMFIK